MTRRPASPLRRNSGVANFRVVSSCLSVCRRLCCSFFVVSPPPPTFLFSFLFRLLFVNLLFNTSDPLSTPPLVHPSQPSSALDTATLTFKCGDSSVVLHPPPPPPTAVAHPHRLRQAVANWRAAAAATLPPAEADRLLDAIVNGVQIPMQEGLLEQQHISPNHQSCHQHPQLLDRLIAELQALGVLTPVARAFVRLSMPCSIVVSHGKEPRLVVDGRKFSEVSSPERTFRPDDLTIIAQQLTPGMSFTSTDVRKLFYLIPTHPSLRPFVCIQDSSGNFYAFEALPMGIQQSPSWAYLLMRPLIRLLRASFPSSAAAVYVDDCLFAGLGHAQTERITAWAIALAHHLGLPLHPSKSKLSPSTEIDFLGMRLRSVQEDVLVQLTPQRRASLLSQTRQLRRRLRNGKPVTPRAIAAFTGLASASMLAVPLSRPLLRHIFSLQSAAAVAVGWSGSWKSVPATLSRPAIAELCELKLLFRSASLSTASLINSPGRAAAHPPDCILTTDASTSFGAGAYLSAPSCPDEPSSSNGQVLEWQAAWPRNPADILPSADRLITPTTSRHRHLIDILQRGRQHLLLSAGKDSCAAAEQPHINVLETATVLLSLLAFAPHFRATPSASRLLIRSDNATTVAVVRRQYSRSPTLAWIALAIHLVADHLQLHLSAVHIAGVLNRRSDELSRSWLLPRARIEHPLAENAFNYITSSLRVDVDKSEWIDAFASYTNHTLPRFWSFRPDPGAEAVDAFAQVWSGRSLFLNPPFILAQTVVRRLLDLDCPCKALVVLPDHVGQGWHARLTAAARRSIRLAPRRFLLNPPLTQRWMLRAWFVTCAK